MTARSATDRPDRSRRGCRSPRSLLRLPAVLVVTGTSASTTACSARRRSRCGRRPAVPRRLLVAGPAAPPLALRRRPPRAAARADAPRLLPLVAAVAITVATYLDRTASRRPARGRDRGRAARDDERLAVPRGPPGSAATGPRSRSRRPRWRSRSRTATGRRPRAPWPPALLVGAALSVQAAGRAGGGAGGARVALRAAPRARTWSPPAAARSRGPARVLAGAVGLRARVGPVGALPPRGAPVLRRPRRCGACCTRWSSATRSCVATAVVVVVIVAAARDRWIAPPGRLGSGGPAVVRAGRVARGAGGRSLLAESAMWRPHVSDSSCRSRCSPRCGCRRCARSSSRGSRAARVPRRHLGPSLRPGGYHGVDARVEARSRALPSHGAWSSATSPDSCGAPGFGSRPIRRRVDQADRPGPHHRARPAAARPRDKPVRGVRHVRRAARPLPRSRPRRLAEAGYRTVLHDGATRLLLRKCRD